MSLVILVPQHFFGLSPTPQTFPPIPPLKPFLQSPPPPPPPTVCVLVEYIAIHIDE